jgi:hypothetical protein
VQLTLVHQAEGVAIDEIAFSLSDLSDQAYCRERWGSVQERPNTSKNGVFQLWRSDAGFTLSAINPIADGQKAKGHRGGGPNVPHTYYFTVKLAMWLLNDVVTEWPLRYVFADGTTEELRPASSNTGVFSVGSSYSTGAASLKRTLPASLASMDGDTVVGQPSSKCRQTDATAIACSGVIAQAVGGKAPCEKRAPKQRSPRFSDCDNARPPSSMQEGAQRSVQVG